MTLWLLLSVALPAILAFMGTYWRKGWITVIAMLAAVVLAWLLIHRLVSPPENTATPSHEMARLLSLFFGSAGAAFGVLIGWLLGRAARDG